jgi:hypothetical protein
VKNEVRPALISVVNLVFFISKGCAKSVMSSCRIGVTYMPRTFKTEDPSKG